MSCYIIIEYDIIISHATLDETNPATLFKLCFGLCSDCRKNHVPHKKTMQNQKALALLYLASDPLSNAANSSVVPTEFAAELTTKNLYFSPSTKKKTEYSFQLFLSIYRYLIFFLKF